MGQALAFDTHVYVKKLEKAGVSEAQAEAQVEALVSIINENLATKRDIEELRRDMNEMQTGLKLEIERSKADIIKWNVGTVFAAVGLFATIIKLLG